MMVTTDARVVALDRVFIAQVGQPWLLASDDQRQAAAVPGTLRTDSCRPLALDRCVPVIADHRTEATHTR